MFSISSPTHCDNCGNKLHVNSHYTRFILSSHGIIALDITYWTCPACKKHLHDQIIGVPGSANYSYEFYEKQMSVRYNGRCSLNNSRRIGETYTEGLTDVCGRAPCATSLWLYEQKQAEISKQELLSQEIGFDGTLYIDGKWVKKCGKKKLEALLGRELSKKEWNKMRYKSIYVVATKEKVILDFEVTKYIPKYEDLVPLIIYIPTPPLNFSLNLVDLVILALLGGDYFYKYLKTHVFCYRFNPKIYSISYIILIFSSISVYN
jgi:hypothetical protein